MLDRADQEVDIGWLGDVIVDFTSNGSNSGLEGGICRQDNDDAAWMGFPHRMHNVEAIALLADV